MLTGPLHTADADGRCTECGEPFPCPTGMATFESVRDQMATHDEQAERTRGKLTEELETLKLLEHALTQRPDQDLHQRVRVNKVSLAIEHLELAIDALELAALE